MKTVLITGAAGFIGKRMTVAARAAGWNVIGLDREVSRDAKLKAPVGAESACEGIGTNDLSLCAAHKVGEAGGVRIRRSDGSATDTDTPPGWITADITGDAPIDLPAGIDAIIHLAGKAHALAEVAQDEAEYFRINTEGTRRMLEAAQRAGVRAFVLFSTVKAAGEGFAQRETSVQPAKPADESDDALPDTPYGQSKRAAEKLVLEGGYVPHAVVLRPCLVYGPTPKGNLEKMITAVRRGRFPPLPEVGNKRSMVHVDDVIAAALLAAEHRAAVGQVYIVADNEPFSTRQLFEWICLAAGRRVPRWTMPLWLLRMLGRVGDGIGRIRGRRFVFDSDALSKLTGSAWYSSAKLQRELGWKPVHTLQNTMGEVLRGFAQRET